MNPSYLDKFSESVEHITVLVYDTSGHLVYRQGANTTSLVTGNRFLLKISPGEYTAVIWGNIHTDDYKVSNEEKLESMYLEVLTDGEIPLNAEPSDLFHGKVDFEVTKEKGREATVSMIKNTNTIHVVLEGIYQTRSAPESDYSVRIQGSNGVYNADNKFYDNVKRLQYQPDYSISRTGEVVKAHADFKIQRMVQKDDVRIRILEGEEVKITELITERLFQSAYVSTEEDLDRFDDFTLVYTFSENYQTFFLTTIKVENWEMKIDPGVEI